MLTNNYTSFRLTSRLMAPCYGSSIPLLVSRRRRHSKRLPPHLPSVSATGDTQEDRERETTCWRDMGRRRRARTRIMQPQESQVLCKSFNTLCSTHSRSENYLKRQSNLEVFLKKYNIGPDGNLTLPTFSNFVIKFVDIFAFLFESPLSLMASWIFRL